MAAALETCKLGISAHYRLPFGERSDRIDVGKAFGRTRIDQVDDALRASLAVAPARAELIRHIRELSTKVARENDPATGIGGISCWPIAHFVAALPFADRARIEALLKSITLTAVSCSLPR